MRHRNTINKEDYTRCWDCDSEGDDAEHTLFHCPGWIQERTEMENYVGTPPTTDNLILCIMKKKAIGQGYRLGAGK